MKTLLIYLLKRSLVSAYRDYLSALEDSPGGRQMASTLPSVQAKRDRCNRLLARLSRLDPDNCPCTSIG